MSLEALPQNPPALISVDLRRSKEASKAIKEIRKGIKPQPEFNFRITADKANHTLDSVRSPTEVTPSEFKDSNISVKFQELVDKYKKIMNHQVGGSTTFEIDPTNGGKAGIWFKQ
jgi:hypothetical protein